ncbi:MAG TPA: isoprenyl transferase [Mycobacteriales bacterium]|nr:isoprenyl transferase [Mycobacteriales bacterium]
MGVRDLLYRGYERHLVAQLGDATVPRHVGVLLDGNRRWARSVGLADVSDGHRRGADKIVDLLGWCEEAGVEVVTLWLLSTENLSRPPEELGALLEVIEGTVARLAAARRWQVRGMGALDLLPGQTAAALKKVEADTADVAGITVNVAVGYGGRREITDAVRSLLTEYAAKGASLEDVVGVLDVEHIAEHLYTRGQPDPDLIIRTSGEQRLSGFLLWQSAHSEFYFCDAYWPAFRRVDFLRALRAYADRNRRFGA